MTTSKKMQAHYDKAMLGYGCVRIAGFDFLSLLSEVAQLEARLEEIARIVANKGIAPEHELALGQLLTVGKIALGVEESET